ncbi:Spo0B C-terminal domain-containing protein [Falsibacillus albus]|nr:Spo0B C-terminal domain-containing protein [Falsibacillus albus]
MNTNWTVVEVLRHARHDWMNKLQLIKGNLALNRPERAQQIIEEIVLEAQQESRLSNLKLTKFATLLLTFNWENHFFSIDYDIIDQSFLNELDDDALYDWFITFFRLLDEAVVPYQDHQLSITIKDSHESAKFFLDFGGILKNDQLVLEWLESQNRIIMEHWDKEQFAFHIHF